MGMKNRFQRSEKKNERKRGHKRRKRERKSAKVFSNGVY
jgi:hypothetical protein